jgi:hypothetical protein
MANYTYKFMTQDEQDDLLVQMMASQERDLHSHTTNLDRFKAIMDQLAADSPLRAKYQMLIDQTTSRIEEVSAIIAATEPTLPPQARIDAAKMRLKAKGAL